jgi:hypothetical protein
VLSTVCQWQALSKDLPPKSTAHSYFMLWDWDGTLEHMHQRSMLRLANIHLAPTAAALGWRDHRLNQRPFGIRQFARISQTTPLSSAARFRFPHLGTPQSTIRVPHNDS